MALCSLCKAIDISTVPVWAGSTTVMDDVINAPSQPHQPTLQSLRLSARSCDLCALFFGRLQRLLGTSPPRGVSIRPEEDYSLDERRPLVDKLPVVIRGLGEPGHDRGQIYGLHVQCGQSIESLGVFADEGSLAASSGLVVGRSPAPVGAPDRILAWLEACDKTHKKCSLFKAVVAGEQRLPTRLLDLGNGPTDYIRLVAGSSVGGEGAYVALSHCWGLAPVIRTTKATLGQFSEVIDPGSLNQTFRDAIMVTRSLGVRYIWIDSLCIVQDDPGDWEREAATMARVYSQAYVTIAASAASSGAQGLLRRAPEQRAVGLYTGAGGGPANGGVSVGPPLTRFRDLNAAALNTRAWTLQERVLSSRIVHFAADQVHWECRETAVVESGSPPIARRWETKGEDLSSQRLAQIGDCLVSGVPTTEVQPMAAQQQQQSSSEKEEFEESCASRSDYDSWYCLIEAYTERHMTKETDKLPALSGIAHAYARKLNTKYVAGLWVDDLATGLLWYSRSKEPLRRVSPYRAPSWSWAAVEGEVHFVASRGCRITEDNVQIWCTSASIEEAGTDPFGMVRNGELTLEAAMRPAELRTVLEPEEYQGERLSQQLLFDDISAIGSASMDCQTPDGQVLCMLVASGFEMQGIYANSHIALLVEPTGKEGEYRRVGLATFYEKRDLNPKRTVADEWLGGGDEREFGQELNDWFDCVDWQTVTFV